MRGWNGHIRTPVQLVPSIIQQVTSIPCSVYWWEFGSSRSCMPGLRSLFFACQQVQSVCRASCPDTSVPEAVANTFSCHYRQGWHRHSGSPRSTQGFQEGLLQEHTHTSPYTRSATYHRCFRWGYPQTLRQDARKVGGPGSVPQQPPIVKLLEGLVALALSLTLYLKDLCVSKREAETL